MLIFSYLPALPHAPGDFLKTSPLTASQWLITVALGAIALPVGILMRLIPCKEDPSSFFVAESEVGGQRHDHDKDGIPPIVVASESV
ncbi:hypothetical protein EON65_28895 [archaeon]|nr:MAG: hypothetical protein EON65_28895 [archaeon]